MNLYSEIRKNVHTSNGRKLISQIPQKILKRLVRFLGIIAKQKIVIRNTFDRLLKVNQLKVAIL